MTDECLFESCIYEDYKDISVKCFDCPYFFECPWSKQDELQNELLMEQNERNIEL